MYNNLNYSNMIDLNMFYAQYCADPESTRFEMVESAARELNKAVQERLERTTGFEWTITVIPE